MLFAIRSTQQQTESLEFWAEDEVKYALSMHPDGMYFTLIELKLCIVNQF
jgi:hypothetical protein